MTSLLPSSSSTAPPLDELFFSVFHNVSYTRFITFPSLPPTSTSTTTAVVNPTSSFSTSSSSSSIYSLSSASRNDDPSSDTLPIAKPTSSLPSSSSSSLPTFLHITCINNVFSMYYFIDYKMFSGSFTYLQLDWLRRKSNFVGESDTIELFFMETIQAVRDEQECSFKYAWNDKERREETNQMVCHLVTRKYDTAQQSSEFPLELATYNQQLAKNIPLTLPFMNYGISSSSLYSSSANNGIPLPTSIFTLFLSQSYEIYTLRQQLLSSSSLPITNNINATVPSTNRTTVPFAPLSYGSGTLASSVPINPTLSTINMSSQDSFPISSLPSHNSSSQQTILNSPPKRSRESTVLSQEENESAQRPVANLSTNVTTGHPSVPQPSLPKKMDLLVPSRNIVRRSHPPPPPYPGGSNK